MNVLNEPPVELQDKEAHSTDFKQCGWCRHASGTHRYNYCIKGNCRLQKSYSNDIKWDTKCLFANASRADITAFLVHHKHQIEESRNTIERHEKYMAILTSMMDKACERPPLPDDRHYKHFNIDNEVAVYVENKWYFGTVKNGYRHHDGCVSYKLEGYGPQEGNDTEFPYTGGYFGCGVAVPIVLLKPEYDFFKDNPQQYIIWCEQAYNQKFNGKTIAPAPIS